MLQSFIKPNYMNQVKNKVQLIGHLGQDPDIKTFENEYFIYLIYKNNTLLNP